MKEKPIESRTRFGHLTVIKKGQNDKHNHIRYICKCDCGKTTSYLRAGLLRGDYKTCGCHKFTSRNGLSHTPEYSIWHAMISRCTNPKNKDYPDYGGRGIVVCDRWIGEDGFDNFINDIGFRPSPKLSLDRIDVNIGYNPENVRWADAITQVNNKRILGDITTFTDYTIMKRLYRDNVINNPNHIRSSINNTKHHPSKRNDQKGLSKLPEYGIWLAMVKRCTNGKDQNWHHYGGRGITVCEQWQGEQGFLTFLNDVGRRPSKKYSLDRINNNKGYSPDNVKWNTKSAQNYNKRSVRDIDWYPIEIVIKEALRRGLIDKNMRVIKKERVCPERQTLSPHHTTH